ncbi:hypothetical protein CGRA01v4_06931 [Colletotrichum graminicola]|nr:hypothetical protein CGRA01v4_06931 [Colletotrichum graminicola]
MPSPSSLIQTKHNSNHHPQRASATHPIWAVSISKSSSSACMSCSRSASCTTLARTSTTASRCPNSGPRRSTRTRSRSTATRSSPSTCGWRGGSGPWTRCEGRGRRRRRRRTRPRRTSSSREDKGAVSVTAEGVSGDLARDPASPSERAFCDAFGSATLGCRRRRLSEGRAAREVRTRALYHIGRLAVEKHNIIWLWETVVRWTRRFGQKKGEGPCC